MSWPGSPRDRGFQRLDEDISDDAPYVDKQSAAAEAAPLVGAGGGDAKRKKHYLKFLSRSKKRVAEVSDRTAIDSVCTDTPCAFRNSYDDANNIANMSMISRRVIA